MAESRISAGDAARIKQLQSLTGDLRCWEVQRWCLVDDWTVDGVPLAPQAVWAADRQLYRLDCPAIVVPESWPPAQTHLEIGAYGYGCLRLTGADGRVSVHPVNEYSRRFRLTDRRTEASATLAPIRDRRVGLATVGDRWLARVVQLEPDVDLLCRTLTAVCEVARANSRVRADLLRLAESTVAAIRWPSGSTDFVSRVSHLENHRRHWFDVAVRPHPDPLTGAQRASLRRAARILTDGLAELRAAHRGEGSVKLVGYAHTDLEWVWPEPVSVPAAVGQFAGALGQLARDPGYHFGQAGSYLYSLVERHEPRVFAELVDAVRAGRWEVLTGMWVEPDANLLSGESLTRQLLHGQAYYQAKFGTRAEICWLPDTFGFSGALPQLLAGSGIDYFFTTRLAKTDVAPHHGSLFSWEGIDGTRILAFAAASPGGYQCVPTVPAIQAAWSAYPDSGVYPHTLQPLGYANGIGPTDDDLADARVLADLPGVPEVRFTSVRDYFADADRQTRHKALPVWRGELYMEAFRGTFTTQGRTKVLHRRAESALVTAEVVDALRVLRTGAAPEDLSQTWHRLLARQTHDIVSGTCVGEIHAAAAQDFADIAGTAAKVTDQALAALGDDLCTGDPGTGLLFVNPTMSWRPVRAVLPEGYPGGQPVAGGRLLASSEVVPPLGAVWAAAWPSPGGVAVTGSAIENELVRVVVADDGRLRSVYDKRRRTELLAGPANVLRAYLDRPFHWDAWDLAENYDQFPLEPPTCTGVELAEAGPYRASVQVTWRFRDSHIEQEIRLWAGSARIDFATRIDWHERRVLLRTEFPTSVRCDYATYECAYGVVHRPTHATSDWDRVRFEAPAHRFVDLSDGTGGVALLNDGRYGHSVRGGALGMSLLRSPVFPDPYADEGEHLFQYALYPHPGDWLAGGVLAEASDLNCPLPGVATCVAGHGGWRPVTVEGLPLALGTLKGAEPAGTGTSAQPRLVLRAYEPAGRRGSVTVTPPEGWAVSTELNLLEDVVGPAQFTFGPHQIRTWSIDRVGR